MTQLQVSDTQVPVVDTATEQLISADNAQRPAMDIYHTPDAFVFIADLPGVQQGDVQLEITERNTLVLRARQRFTESAQPVLRQTRLGNYYRAFELGDNIDRNSVTAKLENGVLEVRLNKRESSRPKRIEIQA
ncbi:MAG: Hsp20/alpha crystallin family protein [Candidatus Sericytochromatia bacterium]